MWKPQQLVNAFQCPGPTLQARGGRTQDQWTVMISASPFGNFAGVVAGHIILLVAGLVFLIQDDNPDIIQGGKRR